MENLVTIDVDKLNRIINSCDDLRIRDTLITIIDSAVKFKFESLICESHASLDLIDSYHHSTEISEFLKKDATRLFVDNLVDREYPTFITFIRPEDRHLVVRGEIIVGKRIE